MGFTSLRSAVGAATLGALAIALASSGCKHRDYYDRDTAQPVRGAPSLGLEISLANKAIGKPSNGDLSVPIRVRNERPEEVRIVFARSELELTNGTRLPVTDDRDEVIRIQPNEDEDFRMRFGDRNQRVSGSSFRVYLFVTSRQGKLIEYVPPLVIQADATPFAFPPRPFRTDPLSGRPADEEFPPPTGPVRTEPGRTEKCTSCGEQIPIDAKTCPKCGVARGNQ